MEMIVLEEESEISVVNENLHDASAKNAASKIHFVEDNDRTAAVPGLEGVGNSCCRDTAVFLVCFVSLTGLILSVSSVNLFVYTSKTVTRHNSEWESKTNPLQTSYNNNLIKERDQLQTSYNNLTKERDQLKTSYNNLTKERDQLQTSYNKLAKKNGDLQRKLEGIEASCKNLTEEREELKKNLHDFASEGWMYFRGSFYNISSTEKTWADSRDDCRRKGADLVIINSKEEQEFTRQFQKYMWIGLTDSETEGVWKWVDGTPVTKSYWGSGEPNNKEDEDCAEIKYHDKESSWNDAKCSLLHLWMCEKKVLP
ncbi:CD209 antigen-like protein C [Epinephelus moara]|uniref:CD209 antigen-like protein C n=1 Tax=Epinephelus moara TaxID=300413 RepID=UPI00214EBBB3|nr:CD209 antigen-like protein C [Epinephelus moara]